MVLSLQLLDDEVVLPVHGSITHGNHKLGLNSGIWQWSIPSIHSCPGRTSTCESICYANDGYYRLPGNQAIFNRNWVFSRTDEFVGWMVSELKRRHIAVMRLHVSGDLYDAEYAWSWYEIFRNVPRTTFFLWTRSWRLDWGPPIFARMSTLPNVWLWYSVDRESGFPARIPTRTRTAYVLTVDEEAPSYRCDLVFRDDHWRQGQVYKKVDGVMVCSVEQGVRRAVPMTCARCKICFSPPRSDVPT